MSTRKIIVTLLLTSLCLAALSAAGQSESSQTAPVSRGQANRSATENTDEARVGRFGGNGLRAADGSMTAPRLQSGSGSPHSDAGILAGMPTGTLQATELAGLLYLYEEEKLARDVYLEYAKMYSIPVFANIAQSEQAHMDLVAELLKRYAVAVPTQLARGEFSNAHLQELYRQFLATGKKSLEDALAAAVAIEDDDIQLLQKLVQSSKNEDVHFVLERLLAGSTNHRVAFLRRLGS